jgi:hypothetical protein
MRFGFRHGRGREHQHDRVGVGSSRGESFPPPTSGRVVSRPMATKPLPGYAKPSLGGSHVACDASRPTGLGSSSWLRAH